jgi:hypothetical protein
MPTSPHVIRLAGIWEIAPRVDSEKRDRSRLLTSEKTLDWTRVRLDRLEAEGLPFPPGCCRRFFNRPTNLAADQPVYLEWTGLRHAALIRLNGLPVLETAGGAETIRVRVDDRLVERNELNLLLLRREGETSADEAEDQLTWPFHECRLLIEEGSGTLPS